MIDNDFGSRLQSLSNAGNIATHQHIHIYQNNNRAVIYKLINAQNNVSSSISANGTIGEKIIMLLVIILMIIMHQLLY